MNRFEQNNTDDRMKIKKRDWVLALVILAAAGCLMLGMYLTRQRGGNTVEIRIDGALYDTHPLDQDDTFTIETAYGVNTVEIKDGFVSVKDADCEGHDCIRQGKISRCNETIVCLPHKLVIEITLHSEEKQQEADFDIVAK